MSISWVLMRQFYFLEISFVFLIQYDSLKIRQLTQHGLENDPAKQKNDITKLEALKKEIKYVLTFVLMKCVQEKGTTDLGDQA